MVSGMGNTPETVRRTKIQWLLCKTPFFKKANTNCSLLNINRAWFIKFHYWHNMFVCKCQYYFTTAVSRIALHLLSYCSRTTPHRHNNEDLIGQRTLFLLLVLNKHLICNAYIAVIQQYFLLFFGVFCCWVKTNGKQLLLIVYLWVFDSLHPPTHSFTKSRFSVITCPLLERCEY